MRHTQSLTLYTPAKNREQLGLLLVSPGDYILISM